ncbi:hypothetical protein Tsubulata_023073 [Turnera subulata]|uniref:Uncharacterized protein n=1 Tax=Turnera subulata TaxID=218843 RepID=A0A9Q0JGL5_9ROSI|nr:hypothetical protein Tsubulata_023073 [Turnera subulata]
MLSSSSPPPSPSLHVVLPPPLPPPPTSSPSSSPPLPPPPPPPDSFSASIVVSNTKQQHSPQLPRHHLLLRRWQVRLCCQQSLSDPHLPSIRSSFLSPLDTLHVDIGPLSSLDLLVLLSKSGSTEEPLRLVPFARPKDALPMFCFVYCVCEIEIKIEKGGGLQPVMEEIVQMFILLCYTGGFAGNVGHDSHILYTLSAVQVLALLDKLNILDVDKVSNCILFAVS